MNTDAFGWVLSMMDILSVYLEVGQDAQPTEAVFVIKTIGIFEAKTSFSVVCEKPMTINERRAEYMAKFGASEEQDDAEFEIPERSPEMSEYIIEDN